MRGAMQSRVSDAAPAAQSGRGLATNEPNERARAHTAAAAPSVPIEELLAGQGLCRRRAPESAPRHAAPSARPRVCVRYRGLRRCALAARACSARAPGDVVQYSTRAQLSLWAAAVPPLTPNPRSRSQQSCERLALQLLGASLAGPQQSRSASSTPAPTCSPTNCASSLQVGGSRARSQTTALTTTAMVRREGWGSERVGGVYSGTLQTQK